MVGRGGLRSGQGDPPARREDADADGGRHRGGLLTAGRQTLRPLPGLYAVCRLPAEAPVPGWAGGRAAGGEEPEIVSITRAPGELSIVCPQERVPARETAERGWRILHVEGPLAFSLTGVVASMAEPLARAGIPIFVLSTYDTDLILVKAADLGRAAAALQGAGHRVLED